MQIDLARYDDLVHGIYDAALRQDRWSEVLAGVAALLEATRAVLFTWVCTAPRTAASASRTTYRRPRSTSEPSRACTRTPSSRLRWHAV